MNLVISKVLLDSKGRELGLVELGKIREVLDWEDAVPSDEEILTFVVAVLDPMETEGDLQETVSFIGDRAYVRRPEHGRSPFPVYVVNRNTHEPLWFVEDERSL